MHLRRARRLARISAAALAVPLSTGGHAADVTITQDPTTGGVQLDGAGGTAEIATGVHVTNDFNQPVVTAPAGVWALTNRGAITSDAANTIVLDGSGSSVTNYGSIGGTSGNSVSLINGGSVHNELGGVISADNSAIVTGHTSPSPPAGAGIVTNDGTITQNGSSGADLVQLLGGGTFTNTGTVSANTGNNAVSVGQGASRTVINSGSITNIGTGSYSAGVLVQGGAATITNTATGQISSTFNGIYASGSSPLTLTNAGTVSSSRLSGSAYAVDAEGGGTIGNSGTISSSGSVGLFVRGSATVTNSGTIAGAGNAIVFSGSAAHALQLDTGSVLDGAVSGGTGTDTLVLLGAGTESLARFTSFETLSMQGSAWTLDDTGIFSTSAEIAAGVLTVGGDLTSPDFSILAGGTLTGTGTIRSAVHNSGNLQVAAGDTLTIADSASPALTGSFTADGGSTFTVGVTPLAAGRLDVSGTADLGGSTLSVLTSGGPFAPSTSYTILTAGHVDGTFGTLHSSSPFLVPSVVYDPTSVVLTLDRSLVSFASAGETPNEIATGTALDTLPTTDPLVTPLASLGLADAASAFDQLSGEAYASAQAALADQSRLPRETALDQVDAAFAAIDALKAGRRPIWGTAFGSFGDIAGDGNAAGLDTSGGGLLVGGDGLLPGNIVASVFGGVSTAHVSIHDRGSEVAAQGFHLGLGAGRQFGRLRLEGGAIGSIAGVTVERDPAFAGFIDTTSASYAEATGQLFTQLAYSLDAGPATLAPFGRLALVGIGGGDYSETGGAAALSGHSNGYGLALASLGLSAGADLTLGDDLPVHAHGRAALQQALGAAPTAVNRFGAGDPFTVSGAPAGGTTLLLDAGLSADLAPTTKLDIAYTGALGTAGQSHALTAKLAGEF